MPSKKRNYVEHIDFVKDNDTWHHAPLKLPRMDTVKLSDIYGVLPFDGARNPSARSNTSHKVFIPYRTAANDWKPKTGIAESAAEAAVAVQFLMSRETYDLHFQPFEVSYTDEAGAVRRHTHDLLVTFRSGHRRLVFVRNQTSLKKPKTIRDILAIIAGTPKKAADDLIIVNADDYTRQRRENLFRMYHWLSVSDDEADKAVWETAQNLRTLYFMKDLFPHVPVSQSRAFQACYRLIARGLIHANLDHVLWEHSQIGVAA